LAPVLNKHNFRATDRLGCKVEVWTVGKQFSYGHPGVGFRLYIDKAEKVAPKTSLHLVLVKKESGEPVSERTFKPELKKCAIEGGYLENATDETGRGVHRSEGLFVGQEGVWEINYDDPFDIDFEKPNRFHPSRGRYLLRIDVAIEDGPTFTFDDIPLRFVENREKVVD
jgi:hypothetical protein